MIMHLMERIPSYPDSKIRPLCYAKHVNDVVYTQSLYSFVLSIIDRKLGRDEPHGCQACESLVSHHW